MTAWATDVEFAYEHGHVYVLDSTNHWSEADVDVVMPRRANFFVPLRIEGWGARPPLDLDAWDHVVEFSLPVPSGRFALSSGAVDHATLGIAPGAYRARWSGRNFDVAATWQDLETTAPDAYRLQLWPGPARAPRAELKRWAGAPRPTELGDLPALFDDDDLSVTARVEGVERTADGLRLKVRVTAVDGRTFAREIRADGVVRWVADGEPFDALAAYDDHPGLLPYTDAQGGLSFTGRPDDADRLASALRAEHAAVAGRFIAFEDVFNHGIDLAAGYGRLAAGPVTLLAHYAIVAERHGLTTHATVTGPGRNALTLLALGRSFVVAERFRVSG